MASRLRKILDNLPPIPPEELERRERAAVRLRERLGHLPGYRDRIAPDDMDFWRNYQRSAVLAD